MQLGSDTNLVMQLRKGGPPITVDKNGGPWLTVSGSLGNSHCLVGMIGGYAEPPANAACDPDPEGNFASPQSSASGHPLHPDSQLRLLKDPCLSLEQSLHDLTRVGLNKLPVSPVSADTDGLGVNPTRVPEMIEKGGVITGEPGSVAACPLSPTTRMGHHIKPFSAASHPKEPHYHVGDSLNPHWCSFQSLLGSR